MIRHYTDEAISPEVLDLILTSVLREPSAGFSQGWASLLMLLTAEDEGLDACFFGVHSR